MAGDTQLDEPAARLLAAASAVAPVWLRRAAVGAVGDAGTTVDALGDEASVDLDRTVEASARELVDRLAELLATDVDEQRTTPLSICRSVVTGPLAEFLRRHAVAPPPPSPGGGVPGDDYGLAPASWADIDEALHEPGLTWGAWKAMTVLRRRRDEGLR